MENKNILQTDVAKLKKDKGCRLCKKLFDCPGKDPKVTLCLQYEQREVRYADSSD